MDDPAKSLYAIQAQIDGLIVELTQLARKRTPIERGEISDATDLVRQARQKLDDALRQAEND